MNNTTAFEIDLPGFLLRNLEAADIPALQNLFEKCADFAWIVDGEGVSATAAQETFYAGPPGKSMEDKFLYGLCDSQGELVTVLEGFKNYPDEGIWWIGLLMLSPALRGQGIGRAIVNGLAKYVETQGGMVIMLGVVEDNRAAYDFWQRVGFAISQRPNRVSLGGRFKLYM